MKTILVPSDFSKNATNALRYAIRLSKLMKTDLVVFHCANISPYVIAAASASQEQVNLLIKEDETFKRKELEVQVKKAYKYLGFKKVPATTKLIVESNPLLVENIIEVAEKNGAGLIVTGTHGATGLNRFFFGSNTASLLSKSDIPVLTIPGKCRYKAIKNIAFSSDLENPANEIDRLIPFAKLVKASIDVLYLDYGIDTAQQHIKNAQAIIKKATYKKIKLIRQPATIEYTLISQVKKYLSNHRHQWLVMFTKERGFWSKMIYGGKTENMSYSINVPLLSFKKTS